MSDNIIAFTAAAGEAHGSLHCWLCQKPSSLRALFCHHCGTIQPVREMDHFMRLGLERRIDIDPNLLERQYASLKRTLDPQRFAIRGMGERGHAARHLEAVEQAYEMLRDPLSRGRYWLVLHEQAPASAASPDPKVAELQGELEGALEAAQCDRVAQKAGQAMEKGIVNLMQALRGQDWRQANAVLGELDGLEGLMRDIRDRRGRLAPNVRNGESGVHTATWIQD